ncbi:P-loop containing nucleoside triphosphate hydrolase protein [Irpex rosettiformis]|uniref:P-loop containing nucleoside triphosphate hydrolase protein n=1 Tax=Irpex rosettiformis TaxID=378272 RepID=A0ACB8UKJ8_9APHY|nr:P-loop containing nucleoside triphosphate hydrolase protein [Irpex rosettiformis]
MSFKPIRGSPLAGRPGGAGRGSGKSRLQVPSLPEPRHDLKYISEMMKTKPLKQDFEENPKSPLSNYYMNRYNTGVTYECTQYRSSTTQSGMIFRATLTMQPNEDMPEPLVAHGDAPARKDAEKLAALNALYQLDTRGLLFAPKKKREESSAAATIITLSDGSEVNFERARSFMDYYCRKFGFGKPDIQYLPKSSSGASAWEAQMIVGGKNIGIGTAANKKSAFNSCYLDVTQYLESCDPALWSQFVEDEKNGLDLGLARPVALEVDETLADQIDDLVQDIRKSDLYSNRPREKSDMHDLVAGGDPALVNPAKYVPPGRRQVSEEFLAQKSATLKERRAKYLEDPEMEGMRLSRASLPVYTRATDILAHVRENEVTICMAATGSGKTTQIPQLILDEWTDRGEGAKCNIICTQPRRIAAISVATRVAAERGENLGGTIGYQVRFEAKLPQDNGSLTFCTTGIFLKRMQSALEESGRNMDDITHIIVDEVHERDIDTDLLLVVLKRLLADRKARGKPIKVVLMSATIDPKLFQEYFPDKDGVPASIIDIPGRSFPVQKQFLDEYLPTLVQSVDARSRWVFQDDLVQKYLLQQLGPSVASIQGLPPSISSKQTSASNEDVDIPYPLIAIAITHALKNSDDGHVLVFLPGWDEISGVQKCLQDTRNWLGLDYNTNAYSIHTLHSSVPLVEQQAIFNPPPAGQRRIILATNIAETSVTIPDVVYVVDSAKVKELQYDPERRISSLVSAWVGSSNLNQRAGRAGRHRPGEYYGLLSRTSADALRPHQTVEMNRADLSNVVMHVKALNFPGMSVEEVLAEAIEPPAPERVKVAIDSLMMVGALDQKKNLTSLGRVLLQLPLDAQMGKLVLFGSFFRCLDQALTLSAILTNRDPFLSPMHAKEEAARRKRMFCSEDYRSDALTILRAYNEWWALQSNNQYNEANRFCVDNFLSKPTLLMIQKIKGHILQSLYDVGVIDVSAGGSAARSSRESRYSRARGPLTVPAALDSNRDSLPLLAALLAIGLQPKYAIRTSDRVYRTARDKAVFIHPSSVNNRKHVGPEAEFNTPAERQLIAFAEKRQNLSTGNANAQIFLVNTTRLDPLTYILFGAYRTEVTRRGLECDDWLPIVGDLTVLDDLDRLKSLMEACMLRVFHGITRMRKQGRAPQRDRFKEDESEDEEEDMSDKPLTRAEIKELDGVTHQVVCLLNDYSQFRIANQSRRTSRPGTPMGSPFSSSRQLYSAGTRSGYSTPRTGGMAFLSRPGTPSRLSRQ